MLLSARDKCLFNIAHIFEDFGGHWEDGVYVPAAASRAMGSIHAASSFFTRFT
jgi:hypothetical protein